MKVKFPKTRLRVSKRLFVSVALVALGFAAGLVMSISSGGGNSQASTNTEVRLPSNPNTIASNLNTPLTTKVQTPQPQTSALPNVVKPYYPSQCTTITIPYATTYKNVTYLSPGQTQSSGGVDGYRKTCTADSNGYKPADLILNPYNKTVYVGVLGCYSYTTSYNAAVSSENTRYYNLSSQLNSALGYIVAHGAGSSSAYEQVEAEISQNNAQHYATLNSLQGTYQAELSTCTN